MQFKYQIQNIRSMLTVACLDPEPKLRTLRERLTDSCTKLFPFRSRFTKVDWYGIFGRFAVVIVASAGFIYLLTPLHHHVANEIFRGHKLLCVIAVDKGSAMFAGKSCVDNANGLIQILGSLYTVSLFLLFFALMTWMYRSALLRYLDWDSPDNMNQTSIPTASAPRASLSQVGYKDLMPPRDMPRNADGALTTDTTDVCCYAYFLKQRCECRRDQPRYNDSTRPVQVQPAPVSTTTRMSTKYIVSIPDFKLAINKITWVLIRLAIILMLPTLAIYGLYVALPELIRLVVSFVEYQIQSVSLAK